jgi:hypothetical protein
MPSAPNVLAPTPQFQPIQNPFDVIQKAIVADSASARQDRADAFDTIRMQGAMEDRRVRDRELAAARQQERSAVRLAEANVTAVNTAFDFARDKEDLAGEIAVSNDGIQLLTGAQDGADPQNMAGTVVKRQLVLRNQTLSTALGSFRQRKNERITIPNAGQIKPNMLDPEGKPLRENLNITKGNIVRHMDNPAVIDWLKANSKPEGLVHLAAQHPDKMFYDEETGELFGPTGAMAYKAYQKKIALAAAEGEITRAGLENVKRLTRVTATITKDKVASIEEITPVVGAAYAGTVVTSGDAMSWEAVKAVGNAISVSPDDSQETVLRRRSLATKLSAAEKNIPGTTQYFTLEPGESDIVALQRASNIAAQVSEISKGTPTLTGFASNLGVADPAGLGRFHSAGQTVANTEDEQAFMAERGRMGTNELAKLVADPSVNGSTIASHVTNLAQLREVDAATGSGYRDMVAGAGSVAKQIELGAQLVPHAEMKLSLGPLAQVHYDQFAKTGTYTPSQAQLAAVSLGRLAQLDPKFDALKAVQAGGPLTALAGEDVAKFAEFAEKERAAGSQDDLAQMFSKAADQHDASAAAHNLASDADLMLGIKLVSGRTQPEAKIGRRSESEATGGDDVGAADFDDADGVKTRTTESVDVRNPALPTAEDITRRQNIVGDDVSRLVETYGSGRVLSYIQTRFAGDAGARAAMENVLTRVNGINYKAEYADGLRTLIESTDDPNAELTYSAPNGEVVPFQSKRHAELHYDEQLDALNMANSSGNYKFPVEVRGLKNPTPSDPAAAGRLVAEKMVSKNFAHGTPQYTKAVELQADILDLEAAVSLAKQGVPIDQITTTVPRGGRLSTRNWSQWELMQQRAMTNPSGKGVVTVQYEGGTTARIDTRLTPDKVAEGLQKDLDKAVQYLASHTKASSNIAVSRGGEATAARLDLTGVDSAEGYAEAYINASGVRPAAVYKEVEVE